MRETRIGMVREWKTDAERRAPLTPTEVRELTGAHPLRFVVESSPVRVFPDRAYREAGAEIAAVLPSCDFILGIKEMPLERLQPGRPHLLFSHTSKGQPYNMALLARVMEIGGTLLDYEQVADDRERRLIFFGRQAGQAGMINALWSYGRRLLEEHGLETPFARLHQAREYASLDDARRSVRQVGAEIHRAGLPPELEPLIVGITGIGNVSCGAQEILSLLDPDNLTPEELLRDGARGTRLGQVVFGRRSRIERRSDAGYDRDEYLSHPERYHSHFDRYLPHLSILVTGHYWESRFPRLVTRKSVHSLFSGPERPRLQVIGDITCDVEGSIECTLRSTTPKDPVYVYDPATGTDRDGFQGPGLVIMAVDILPSEIPRESSEAFGAFLRPHLPAVAMADYAVPWDSIDLPPAFKRSVIVHRGALTPRFAYLESHLDRSLSEEAQH